MKPLKGKTALVTAGPTYEPIDPVRFIGNHSSGKQGIAIAKALADAGASVTLVLGPVKNSAPEKIRTLEIKTAQEMLEACQNTLPVDITVCAAAVSDWTPLQKAEQKMKKRNDHTPPVIELAENPDILKTISNHEKRPLIVVGFAAETENLLENAQEKLARKGCDIILANLIEKEAENVFGSDQNHVLVVDKDKHDDWGSRSKDEIAQKLTSYIAERIENE